MDGMDTVEWSIERIFRGGGREELNDRVAVESPLEIVVNGVPLVALMRLPGQDRELAVGFCLTEKVISSVDDIRLLKHCGDDEGLSGPGPAAGGEAPEGAGSRVELEVERPGDTGRFAATYLVRTGCGGADLGALQQDVKGAVASRQRFPLETLHGLGEKLARGQEVFRATGGTHGAAVFTAQGEEVAVREDVGRHNALDKAVGACALRRIPLQDKLLFISGRVSYEMALKAVRVGLPCLASLAAPTDLGLRLAREAGLTVVGFADGRRCNVYTHGWRLEG
jgi:FdhD protein